MTENTFFNFFRDSDLEQLEREIRKILQGGVQLSNSTEVEKIKKERRERGKLKIYIYNLSVYNYNIMQNGR